MTYDLEPDDYLPKTISAKEINAVKNENIVRAQLVLPLRTHYSNEYIFNVIMSSTYKKFYSKQFDGKWANGYYLIDKGYNEFIRELDSYKNSNSVFNYQQYKEWFKSNFKPIIGSTSDFGYSVKVFSEGENKKSVCLQKK